MVIFRRELLNAFKRNYTSIATKDQQMIKKLKEGSKELASLEQPLIEIEKTDVEDGKI